MNYLNGGYVMIDKADSNIYAKALGALNAGKPILWYENSTTCYYIDSISKSGDDIVLTKGGKTITITDANVVTENGEIQSKLYMYRFSGDDSNNVTFYIKIVSSKKFDTLSDLIDGLKGVTYIDMTAEDSTYKHYQWITYVKTETELQFEELYDNEQNDSILISSLDNFSISII